LRNKILLIAILILILSIGTTAHADLAERVAGHWSESEISETFMAYYFPYLAKNGFENFDPNGFTTRQEFSVSLISLFREHDYTVSGLGDTGALTRIDMAYEMGRRLVEAGFEIGPDYQITFQDTTSVSEDRVAHLTLLHQLGVVKGESNSVFNPARKLTQAEAVVLLQRLDAVFKKETDIPFKITWNSEAYDRKEEMTTIIADDVVLIEITKQFNTPGYGLDVEKVVASGDLYRIHFKITPPPSDAILPQVITYKTLTIEIPRESLGEPPYNFVVEGFRTTGENR
jgi:hypothetical protein